MKLPAWFKPYARRLRLMTARAVINLINDAPGLQLLQVEALNGEIRDRVERFQDYGFSSHPLPGAEAIALSMNANRNHMAIIKVDDRRYRIKSMAQGEVALYTDEGDVIHFKRGQLIEIKSGAHVKVVAPQCTIDAANTHITGAVQIDGAVICGATITASGQVDSAAGVSTNGVQLGTHVHGGVATGTGNTGGPQ